MTTVAFIGDELTASGYRLAGAAAFVVPREETRAALELARSSAALILIGAAHAASLPDAELAALLSQLRPLTVVVDDILAEHAPPDLDQLVLRALGVEAP
jgi:vacuolar-type H+-ATPase subunit F/Vma7